LIYNIIICMNSFRNPTIDSKQGAQNNASKHCVNSKESIQQEGVFLKAYYVFCSLSDVTPRQLMKSIRNDTGKPVSNPANNTCWTWANLGTTSGRDLLAYNLTINEK
jgi:hypothetical protein